MTLRGTLSRGKLRLFRKFKDPAILKPQFHSIYKRLAFLDQSLENSSIVDLQRKSSELVDFIATLESGEFFAKQVKKLTTGPSYLHWNIGEDGGEPSRFQAERSQRDLIEVTQKWSNIFRSNRDEVVELCVEVLRFQNW